MTNEVPRRLHVCRMEISEDAENECWDVICIGEAWETTTNTPVEALEAAYQHYHDVPHRGRMLIDFTPAVMWPLPAKQ